ncbi:MAG: NUDIX domain-containing protein [Oscillospiraceae bacterium]
MELGALVCLPNGAPLCGQCPLQAICRASAAGNPCAYPVRAPKAARRIEERTVFVFSCDGRQALEKRPPEGLLAGLWQYPNVLGKLSVAQAIAQAEQWGVRPRQLEKSVERQHIFTHITWRMTAYYFQCGAAPAAFIWAAPSEIAQRFALPTAFHMFFEEMK